MIRVIKETEIKIINENLEEKMITVVGKVNMNKIKKEFPNCIIKVLEEKDRKYECSLDEFISVAHVVE